MQNSSASDSALARGALKRPAQPLQDRPGGLRQRANGPALAFPARGFTSSIRKRSAFASRQAAHLTFTQPFVRPEVRPLLHYAFEAQRADVLQHGGPPALDVLDVQARSRAHLGGGMRQSQPSTYLVYETNT